MKIYTKKGDEGFTTLFGTGSYSKDHVRIEAYGTVDELNSVIGTVIAEIAVVSANLEDSDSTRSFLQIIHFLQEIQKQLFVIGAELATPNPSAKMEAGFIQLSHVTLLEKEIDQMETELKPLTQFILPGGSKPASLLHLARTVCRRAERKVISLFHEEKVRSELIVYLNRLSDFLFVMARLVNHQLKVEDLFWKGILK